MRKRAVLAACTALSLAAAAAYLDVTKAHYPLLYPELLAQTEPPLSESLRFELAEPESIAHACGAIDGEVYTNSREAFLKALSDGWRFIEIDLRKTLDGVYFGAHRVKDFNRLTGHPWLYEIPPTAHQLKERKLYGRFTPLLLTEAAELLKDRPDVYLVTDKASDFTQLLAEFPYPERLIVEVRTPAHAAAARKAGIRHVALSTQDFALAQQNGIDIVVTPPEAAATPEAQRFADEGGLVLAASFASAEDAPEALRRRGFFVYADEN